MLGRFGLDAAEFTERHKLAVPELQLGRLSLAEYLTQTVFYTPREFTPGALRAPMEGESQTREDALALARELSGRSSALNNEGHDLIRLALHSIPPGTVPAVPASREGASCLLLPPPRDVSLRLSYSSALRINAYRIRTLGLRDFLLAFFTSCSLGVMKPDPAIYRLGLGLVNRRPGEVVMVDDCTQNAEAARSVGMKAVQDVSAAQLREELAALGAG